ncbi:isochorismatase hydrolase [Tieghemostelium lacteum]|uniref:Isochorismatase hydrolase n=1 Tax=Tieghemostelium lacteum TaxID=361077 RepID=A0A151ZIX5_TIELA|nr:isochorismatase hydrolase [Tieghemostelium lacteum]|eukprot:KYQ93849.1 isochorismatase hydrolase [Tieghemostelium lacteum]
MANKDTALIIIDVQMDYFPGGKWQLKDTDKALANVKKVLQKFRDASIPVIHIQHLAPESFPFFNRGTKGADIHPEVKPLATEPVIEKEHANSFKDTTLLETLKAKGIKNLVITGMMTHNCVDSTTRAAVDLGYQCTLLGDATSSRDLQLQDGTVVPADQVKSSFLAALGWAFAKLVNTDDYLASI